MKPASGHTILVVDDLPENCMLISKFLEGEGHEIRTAHSGSEALKSIEAGRPDLVLLDVMMPDIDGIEVCRRIKALEGEHGFLPVVLITAYGAREIRRQGIEAGAEDFLSKPFQGEELVARIRNLLRTKRLYDDLSRAYERNEKEVAAIGALQRSLLPERQPDLPGIRIYTHYQPSRMAGGDFFDYLEIDDHRLGIAIGDVSGHGPQAAVLMAMVKMVLHTCPSVWSSPAELLMEADRHLLKFVPAGEFITMFYGVLDTQRESFTFASAGHCPAILFGPNRAKPQLLKTEKGFPLCLDRKNAFDEKSVSMAVEDCLLLYTDGIIEAHNPEREILGLHRLAELVQAHSKLRADRFTQELLDEVRRFAQGEAFRDDCTLLLVEWWEHAEIDG